MQKLIIAGMVQRVNELKQVGDDKVLNFSVQVSNGKDKDGNWRDSTFFDAALWGKRAESVANFLTKGTKVVVEGRPGARAHEGKAYQTITVQEFTLLGGGDSGGQQQERQQQSKPDPLADEIPF